MPCSGNSSPAAVGFSVGGQQRGQRDNLFFSFVVEHNGKPLPPIVAHDFGERRADQEIKPGAAVEVTDDLTSWAKLDAPGAYRAHCTYKAELVPGVQGPSWPDHGHETWDTTLTGSINFVVV